jgi:hypothetical protein
VAGRGEGREPLREPIRHRPAVVPGHGRMLPRHGLARRYCFGQGPSWRSAVEARSGK